MYEFIQVVNATSKIKNDERILRAKDDLKNCILTGYYSALYSRQKSVRYPEKTIFELYSDKPEDAEISKEELQKGIKVLDRFKGGGKNGE